MKKLRLSVHYLDFGDYFDMLDDGQIFDIRGEYYEIVLKIFQIIFKYTNIHFQIKILGGKHQLDIKVNIFHIEQQ